MSKRSFATTEPETDSDDESNGFSQKYQLKDYKKKFKSNGLSAAAKTSMTDTTSTQDGDNGTLVIYNDTYDNVCMEEDDDDATCMEDNASNESTPVTNGDKMKETTEEWLRRLRQHYMPGDVKNSWSSCV
jgi:hypothetical protein